MFQEDQIFQSWVLCAFKSTVLSSLGFLEQNSPASIKYGEPPDLLNLSEYLTQFA